MSKSKPDLKVFCENAKAMFLPKLIRKIGNRDDAQDILQETLLLLIKKYDTIEDNPEKWVGETIKRLSLDFYKKKQKEKDTTVDVLDFEFKLTTYDPDYEAVKGDYESILTEAVKRLPSDKREMCIDFLLTTREYNPKKKKYETLDKKAYCEKYGISKTTFYEVMSELEKGMRDYFEIWTKQKDRKN